MNNSDKNAVRRGCLILLAASFIWGTGIVAQKLGAGVLGPFTFNALRCLLGMAVLLPVAVCFNRQQERMGKTAGLLRGKEARRALLIAGIIGGLGFFGGAGFQQLSLIYVTAGKSGFLNSLYILVLPIAGLLRGKKISLQTWAGIGICLIGLYLLCVTESFTFAIGDVFGILGAFCWTFEILTVDHYCKKLSPLSLMAAIITVAGLASLICAVLFEDISPAMLLSAWKPVLYAGVMLVAVAYSLQAWGQQTADPTLTGLIFSMESAFALLAGLVLLQETMTPREGIGCGLLFIALLATQVDIRALRQAHGRKRPDAD